MTQRATVNRETNPGARWEAPLYRERMKARNTVRIPGVGWGCWPRRRWPVFSGRRRSKRRYPGPSNRLPAVAEGAWHRAPK